MSQKMKPIPINMAQEVAQRFGYDQVVIYARRVGEDGGEHLTTYGTTKQHCRVAGQMGDTLKRLMGWQTSKEQWVEREALKRHAESDCTGRMWQDLSEEQREHFRDQARADWDAD